MKKSLLLALGCLVALSNLSWSQPDPPASQGSESESMGRRRGWFTNGEDPGQGRQGGRRHQGMRKRMMARFDTNGDGQLDDQERGAARQQFMEKHKDKWARFDTNGDGQLDEQERGAARQQFMEKHKDKWARFDSNGDGQLDDQERAAARAERLKQWDKDGDGKLSPEERQAMPRRHRRDGKRVQPGAPPSNQGAPPLNQSGQADDLG